MGRGKYEEHKRFENIDNQDISFNTPLIPVQEDVYTIDFHNEYDFSGS